MLLLLSFPPPPPGTIMVKDQGFLTFDKIASVVIECVKGSSRVLAVDHH